MEPIFIRIPEQFGPYLEAAAIRLGSLYPSLNLKVGSDGFIVSDPLSADPNALKRDVLQVVYREKIYSETLSMRQALIQAVTSR